ncbi:hypothetical protein ATL78_12330 [Escherichia coli]|nr:hypothetical protein ATL78_12330 [Escherichia coli]KYN59420.1 hypothetical protein AZ620_02570 [Escherichia coli]KYZ89413.1 hypothetical protein ACM49_10550 [Escherichia coli]OAF42910.1 hypothetical protein AXK29_02650 [Escherichia coli]
MKKKTIFQCVILFFSILNIHVGMAGPEQVSMHIYGNVVDQAVMSPPKVHYKIFILVILISVIFRPRIP